MKIIVLDDELGQSRTFEFQKEWLLWALIAGAAVLLLLAFSTWLAVDRGYRVEQAEAELTAMQEQTLYDQQQLDSFYGYSNATFAEYAKQTGLLQARVARLEALGGRLADMGNFNEEFDFYSEPAMGGPESELLASDAALERDLLDSFEQLGSRLARREEELKALEELLADKQIYKEQYLAGQPAESGWLSSPFGRRIDPFRGTAAWHNGVDFAGKEGTNVLAVASGVVVWSGDRYGYGQMVEIDHGNGFKTRYGHNRNNLVKVGDVVTKGQTIAQMGSTGRSTGPHVHFEVLKNGHAVDPSSYIYRRSL